jgi:gamma-glutamyltranspeptidase
MNIQQAIEAPRFTANPLKNEVRIEPRIAADVLAELEASHRKLLAAAAGLPEGLFGAGGAARDPFEGAGAGHYREHSAQIRQWRQR